MNKLKWWTYKFKSWFGIWTEISRLPKWVKRCQAKWERKWDRTFGHRPYDQKCHFTGKNFIYRINYVCVAQGQIEEKYYRKLK